MRGITWAEHHVGEARSCPVRPPVVSPTNELPSKDGHNIPSGGCGGQCSQVTTCGSECGLRKSARTHTEWRTNLQKPFFGSSTAGTRNSVTAMRWPCHQPQTPRPFLGRAAERDKPLLTRQACRQPPCSARPGTCPLRLCRLYLAPLPVRVQHVCHLWVDGHRMS